MEHPTTDQDCCRGSHLCGVFDHCPMPDCIFRVQESGESATILVGYALPKDKKEEE